ncbi:LysE family translocator [Actinoplanes sp. TFC3]|uniref:LysE family translocator n=1 Tax=Actinoplanes sp. TFC3 TaxID=1710355 RepID=UPI0008304420|nr:LysE family translocator [Actinoplanes sp. TFC3]
MISWTVLAGYLAAITLLMITPGPDMMFVLTNATRYGARAGIAAALGVAIGEAVHVAAVIGGLAAALTASPGLFALVRYAGAAYLVLLGVQALRQRSAIAGTEPGVSDTGWPASLQRGLLTNLLNPKMVLFSVAFLPQFVRPAAGDVSLQLLVLGALFVAVQLVVDISIAAAAGRIRRRLSRGRTARWINRLCAGVFIALGLRLAIG